MATDKNTIKQWFKTTLKPTQEQFWAWMDSYWHKSESIPPNKIDGLAETLGNKADATQLEAKANKDASNIDVNAYKQALNVQELPSNLATVDEGNKVGNVHTKEQITQLLENSGKNIGNSNLKIPVGTVRTLDVTDAKLQITGLENKSADASFNRKIKINEEGELAISEEADITLNIPEQFTGSATLGSTTINVNHIYPDEIPERPSFADEIKNIMANYKNIDFTTLAKSNWQLWTKDNKGLAVNTIDDSGYFSLSGNHTDFSSYSNDNLVVSATSNIILPQNKDWIVKIKGTQLNTDYHGGELYIGLSRNAADDVVSYGVKGGNYSTVVPMGDVVNGEKPRRSNFLALIIKTGNVISVMVYGYEKNCWVVQNAFAELGDYIPKILINKNKGSISGSMAYKILN